MTDPRLEHQHHFERGSAPDAPVLVTLHGTGADEHDLVPLARAVAPGSAILSPLGKVRENGMPRWFRRHAEGVFDEDDLRRRAAELAGFLEAACERYDLPRDRLVALGFSNGANIGAALLLLYPRVLSGAVLLRAMVPVVPDELPDLTGVPVLLAAGRRDPLIPAEGVRRLEGVLTEAGAAVRVAWSNGGHGLEPDEPRLVHDFLQGLGERAGP